MTSYKMPCIITRGKNVYGPHRFPEKVIPKFTLLASRGAPLIIHNDGGATRSYLYVEDVAEAFETILTKGKIGETYNVGTQNKRTVLHVAGDISKHSSCLQGNSRTFKTEPTTTRDTLFATKSLHLLVDGRRRRGKTTGRLSILPSSLRMKETDMFC